MSSAESLSYWVRDLLAVVAAAPPDHPARACGSVAFEAAGERLAVDLNQAIVVPPTAANVALVASLELFGRLLRGAETMQHAYLTGALELHGPPAALLRLAFLFELTATAHRS
jgi:hypothetical protein